MSGFIDMTTANPFINKEGSSKKRPRSSPVAVPNAGAPKLSLSVSASTFAAMKAHAAVNLRSLRQHPSQQLREQPQASEDDQTMKSANSLHSRGSLMSTNSPFGSIVNQTGDDDYSSSSSWSDSDDEDEDDDGEYIMYAPTVKGGRGHLLRPMSLDKITALAAATGARKPACLQSHSFSQSRSFSLSQHGGAPLPSKLQKVFPGPKSHRSASMPDFASQMAHYKQMRQAQQSNGKTGGSAKGSTMKPDEHLKAILKAEDKTITYCSYASLDDYFLKVEPQHVQAFQQDVISAVRGKSVEDLEALQKQGKMLQCCNKFGESIVHMACRQSSAEVLKFLMTTAKVNIRVCCDSGRTPLHDACWTTSPDFDIVKMLIEECPDFLTIKDKRGFTPLAYVPHGQWGVWNDFLDKNKGLLVFTKLK